jgi:hypothetical protein
MSKYWREISHDAEKMDLLNLRNQTAACPKIAAPVPFDSMVSASNTLSASAVVLLVLLMVDNSFALSVSEKTALEEILQEYPSLAFVTPEQRDEVIGIDVGLRWTTNFDNLCTLGVSGYEIYGVHCSSAGHVDGLLLYVFLLLSFRFLNTLGCSTH